MLLISRLFFCCIIQTALGSSEWYTLSATGSNALRSQRDVCANITIDQLTNPGVSVSNVVFNYEGYTSSALDNVKNILGLNVPNLLIDLYWNENLRKFQLCPVQFSDDLNDFINATTRYFEEEDITYECQVGLELNDLIDTILEFLKDTDTNLDAGIIVLIFNLYYLDEDTNYDSSLIGSSNDTLSSILNNAFSDRMYTPELLEANRADNLTFDYNFESSETGFPNLTYFLYQSKSRIVPTIWKDTIPSNSSYSDSKQNSYIFNQSTFGASFDPYTDISDLVSSDAITEASQHSWRYVYDDPDTPFTHQEIYNMIRNGYSPIVNHTLNSISDISTLLNGSFWSWNSTEPLTDNVAKKLYDQEDSDVIQKAYECALTNVTGTWFVSNCYRSMYVVCRNDTDQFDWVMNTNKATYFDASDACNDGFFFTVPKTALQQKALINYLERIDINESVWIDMNSIAVSDCWVSGGPYASCPYQTVTSRRNFVHMLTPAAVLAFCILVGILAIRIKSVPVQDNRKHWKKLINKYTENEYEGVPS